MAVYIIFRFWVFVFKILPFSFLYALSDGIAFLLRKVVKYRYKVVYQNLSRAFPNMSELEKKKVIHQFYKNLGDLLIESIKGFSLTEKQIKKRFKVVNPEILETYIKNNKSVIAVTAHTGNWEWGILSAPFYTKMIPVGLYKPLSNKKMDSYMKNNRTRTGSKLTSIYITAITFEREMKESSLVMMVADQSPSNVKKAYWVHFLGIDTACLHGPEKYAKIYNMPVLYFNVHRTKRGCYDVEFIHVTDNPADENPGKITADYMQLLEQYIRKNPSNWLWSHKRWKHSRTVDKN